MSKAKHPHPAVHYHKTHGYWYHRRRASHPAYIFRNKPGTPAFGVELATAEHMTGAWLKKIGRIVRDLGLDVTVSAK
jgi:hypothetical protein